MAQLSTIEWTDATWNPVRGCTKISPGCKYCYAERFAERWRGTRNHPYEHGFDLRLVPGRLLDPLRWSTPRRIFVNSMSDLFHEDVPSDYIALVFAVMIAARWHTFQVLTKRAARMRDFVWSSGLELSAARHIWLGVSVEDCKYGLPRIPSLMETNAGIRFLSIEPLLEDLGRLDLRGIDWVIVGGESGPAARPMRREWVRAIRRQCDEHRVPFFFKQWGGVRKGRRGRKLDGRTHDASPVSTASEAPSPQERKAMTRRLEDVIGAALHCCGQERPARPGKRKREIKHDDINNAS